MATLQDGDLLLVQRGATSYKHTAKELFDQAAAGVDVPDTLGDLSDVIAGGTSGQVLTLVGAEWQAADISLDGALAFQGVVDATTESAPDAPHNGWVYINNGAGTVEASWTGIAGESVSGGEQLVYDGTTRSGWAIITGGGDIGVESVTANGGLKETGGDPANPVVAIDRTAVDAWYMGADSVATKPDGGLKGDPNALEIDRTVTDSWYVQPKDLTNLTDGSADLVVNSIKANKFDLSALSALS